MIKVFKFLKDKFNKLGPGFITGAADDDPSGVATYSIAGAQFGYKLNWLSLYLIPMMTTIQEMCGRIGMTSGMGLAGVIKKYYSKKLLYFSIILLIFANTLNIAADLGIIAASLEMVLKIPSILWLVITTLSIILMEVFISYSKYSTYLKWLGLILIVYVITAFIVKQDWRSISFFTFIPHIEFNLIFLMTMVGFIGTTISPYLFFWQASEEVEEEIKSKKIADFGRKPLVIRSEIVTMRRDTTVGMIFSNLIAAFILITTAGTLNKTGITNITSPQEAAFALKPLAGNFAFLLFAIGIIGIGLQSIPVLAGGITYAISETFGFKEGLGKKLKEAKAFYVVLGLATLIGAVIDLVGINAITALYYVAIINGVISVPLIAIIIKMADDKRVVGKFRSRKADRVIAWITFTFIGIASILMIFNLIKPIFHK
ncbi:MAG: divalent metal cation transporter [Cyanobacteria bacterium]|nr:divalent metal cation transporter [Cyanobacteriota bacterium]